MEEEESRTKSTLDKPPGQKPLRTKAIQDKTPPIFGSTKTPPDRNPQRRNVTSL